MRARIFILGSALVVLAFTATLWMMRDPRPALRIEASPPVAGTIEASGMILGLAIGAPMDEARKKLDPLRVPTIYTPDRKEETGRRIYWKLRETDFDWIMAWGGVDGKITRLRAVFRADRTKPFREIGNLGTAAGVTPNMARWNLRQPGGPNFRLIAQGAEQQAQTVYMFSLELPREEPARAGPGVDEED